MKHGDKFEIEVPYSIVNKVGVIKAIRYLTSMGLKESKDIADTAGKHVLNYVGVDPTLDADYQARYFDDQAVILNSNGVMVHGSRGRILQDLRKLAAQAMEAAEDELANEILQLVLAEKLKMP